MKKKHRLHMKLGVASLLLVAAGCSKSSSKDGGTDGGTNSGEVSDLKGLNLSSVLALDLPASVKGTGTAASLSFADEVKSFEACELRQKVREALSNISQAGSMICHLEQASLKFGKKYNVKFPTMGTPGGETPPGGPGNVPQGPGPGPGEMPPGGPGMPPPMPTLRLAGPTMPESLQLWIDDSKKADGVLKVYMCTDKKLTQYFEITGTAAGKAKGKIMMKGDMNMGSMSLSYHRAALFDNNFTADGKTSITVKELMSISSDQFGTESMRRLLALDLDKAGVSKVTGSIAGNQMGVDQAFASVGIFSETFGAAVAKGKAQGGTEVGSEFSNKSYFDGAGYVVDPANHSDVFGEGKILNIDTTAVPGYLSADFKPEDFPAGAWDCSGTEEDFDLNPTSGGQASCDEEWNQIPDTNCFDPAMFQHGPAAEIPTSDVPPEDFEEVPAK